MFIFYSRTFQVFFGQSYKLVTLRIHLAEKSTRFGTSTCILYYKSQILLCRIGFNIVVDVLKYSHSLFCLAMVVSLVLACCFPVTQAQPRTILDKERFVPQSTKVAVYAPFTVIVSPQADAYRVVLKGYTLSCSITCLHSPRNKMRHPLRLALFGSKFFR